MRITRLDRSNYFKGLLLLIRKDQKITQPEIDLVKRIGKSLNFDKEFCANAIDEILNNTFIVDEPPVFSTKEFAMKFIKDGLSLAFSDDECHPHEENWLKSTAGRNGLSLDFLTRELENAQNRKCYPGRLEIEDIKIILN